MGSHYLCPAGKAFSLSGLWLVCKVRWLNVGPSRPLSGPAFCICAFQRFYQVPHVHSQECYLFPQSGDILALYPALALLSVSATALPCSIPWVAGSVGSKVSDASPPSQPWGAKAPLGFVHSSVETWSRTAKLHCWHLNPESTCSKALSNYCENFRGTTQILDCLPVSSPFPQRTTCVSWTPKTHKIQDWSNLSLETIETNPLSEKSGQLIIRTAVSHSSWELAQKLSLMKWQPFDVSWVLSWTSEFRLTQTLKEYIRDEEDSRSTRIFTLGPASPRRQNIRHRKCKVIKKIFTREKNSLPCTQFLFNFA